MQAILTNEADGIGLTYHTTHSVMRYSHIHPLFELYFCPDNIRQRVVVNGVEYTYHHPCVIISSPYTIHSMSSDDDPEKGYRRYVFSFDGSLSDQLDRELLPNGLLCRNVSLLFCLTEDDAESLAHMIETCRAKESNELKLLLAMLLNKLVKVSPLENALKVGHSAFYIQDVLQYIAEHYAEKPTADTVARRLAISRSKLNRDFKQFTGVTVHEFLDMCRLNHAKLLLVHNKDLSVSAVAEACGFSGENYFFPFFKKHTGLTPAAFRNGGRE